MSFFHAHPLIVGLGAYFLFSNVVGAMEKPDDKSSALYKYIFRLSHVIHSAHNFPIIHHINLVVITSFGTSSLLNFLRESFFRLGVVESDPVLPCRVAYRRSASTFALVAGAGGLFFFSFHWAYLASTAIRSIAILRKRLLPY